MQSGPGQPFVKSWELDDFRKMHDEERFGILPWGGNSETNRLHEVGTPCRARYSMFCGGMENEHFTPEPDI